jgi:serine/threonine-protein kinase
MTVDIERVRDALSGSYALERELGAGGMATVYLARDVKHQRDVAVKVMRSELTAAVGAERFLREIRITAQLNHPHILPLHDSGEADDLLFYVMPYVEAGSLRRRLGRGGVPLALKEALRITGQVGAALDHAHRHNVIHRDVKPENIRFSEDRLWRHRWRSARHLHRWGRQRK